MTTLSNANAQRFNGLRDQALAGIKAVNAARREASEAGDAEAERLCVQRRETLRDSLVNIELAEEAWLRSTLSVSEAETRLKAAGAQARAAVASMKSVAQTLQQAAVLIDILTRLVTVFG
jgi:hypothetical protein